jgi:hypothetical protein
MPQKTLGGVRIHVIITKPQLAALDKFCEKTGLTRADHMRRAVDFYLANAAERLARRPT